MRILYIGTRTVVKRPEKNGVGTCLIGLQDFCQKYKIELDILYDPIVSRPIEEKLYYKYHPELSNTIDLISLGELQSSILKAVFTKKYTVIKCESPISLLAVTSLGIHKIIPTVFRTHSSDLFLKDSLSLKNSLVIALLKSQPNVMVLTPSKYAAERLNSLYGISSKVLPLLRPKDDLLLSNVLPTGPSLVTIARYDEGKDPESFAHIAAKLNIPVRILTSSPASARRWKKLLKAKNIKDYEVKYGLRGQEKIDFLAKGTLALHTSKREMYGLSPLETAEFCPTVVVKDYQWYKNYSEIRGELKEKLYVSKFEDLEKCLLVLRTVNIKKYRKNSCARTIQDKTEKEWLQFLNTCPLANDIKTTKRSALYKKLSSGKKVSFQKASKRDGAFNYNLLKQAYGLNAAGLFLSDTE